MCILNRLLRWLCCSLKFLNYCLLVIEVGLNPAHLEGSLAKPFNSKDTMTTPRELDSTGLVLGFRGVTYEFLKITVLTAAYRALPSARHRGKYASSH